MVLRSTPHVHVHVHNGFVNKTIGTTQRVASDTTQEQSTNEKNQTDRIRHHKRCRRSGGVATAPPRRNPHGVRGGGTRLRPV